MRQSIRAVSYTHLDVYKRQIINKLLEGYNKDHKAELTDEKVLEATADHKEKLHIGKSKGGIVVKGIRCV